MNEKLLHEMFASIIPWKQNFGQGQERRGEDSLSWYDLSINVNSLPCEKEIAVIVTAWTGQLKWLTKVLESYRRNEKVFLILAYDNPFYPWMPVTSHDILRCLPNMKHYLLANTFVMKHITCDGDKRNGWFWNVRYAQGVIKQFPNIKYVYCTNGDCLIEKPEGMKDVIALLGDKDVMPGQSNNDILHTADVIYKVKAFHKIYNLMGEWMEYPVLGSRSPELMLKEAIAELGLKWMPPPLQPKDPNDGTTDMYCCYNQDSTWKQLLGFRNLFAEYEVAGNEGREPLVKEYVDNYMNWLYFGGEEKETLCKYWETGDRRYLYMWLDRWEDSSYNRYYTPLNFYSKEPIYDKEKDAIVFRRI